MVNLNALFRMVQELLYSDQKKGIKNGFESVRNGHFGHFFANIDHLIFCHYPIEHFYLNSESV
jgi:hypothetical protein